jgi:hypothetical protein
MCRAPGCKNHEIVLSVRGIKFCSMSCFAAWKEAMCHIRYTTAVATPIWEGLSISERVHALDLRCGSLAPKGSITGGAEEIVA